MSILVNYATKIVYDDGIKEIDQKGGEWENQLNLQLEKVLDGEIKLEHFIIIANSFNRQSSSIKYDFSQLIEEIENDRKHNKKAIINRQCSSLNYNHLLYRHFECRSEVVENKFDYMGKEIRGKIVCGIGPHAIVLMDDNGKKDFHNYIPLIHLSGKKDGCEVARELITKYGDFKNNFHLRYIVRKYKINLE